MESRSGLAFLVFLAEAGGCTFEGLPRKNGETWRPDACTSCYCEQGRVECSQLGSCTPGRGNF
ncbi:hypothetical protein Cfor_07758 [Coptotermes formosanus]|uniref:VWFC domain-containing protein n=1 Tax=Coptotermes formosanus TaxID=36987 RepID=A0A6L2P852_COPFO|nr:hypothetical protein Cfor_07758 [Coptotermes formosanus]